MKMRHLYRASFQYDEAYSVDLAGIGAESRYFFLFDGRCEGEITGKYRGANAPLRRTDGTFQPDLRGVIETDDGATLLFDIVGYGRAYPVGRRQIVASARHYTDAAAYSWLNDAVCAVNGEVRTLPGDAGAEIVIDVLELQWQPLDNVPESP
jgi:hypothetical protein